APVGQRLVIVAEAAGLRRSATGESGREEVDHDDLLPDVIGRLPGLAAVVGALKGRSLVADLQLLGGRAAEEQGKGGAGEHHPYECSHDVSPCGKPETESEVPASAGTEVSSPGGGGISSRQADPSV